MSIKCGERAFYDANLGLAEIQEYDWNKTQHQFYSNSSKIFWNEYIDLQSSSHNLRKKFEKSVNIIQCVKQNNNRSFFYNEGPKLKMFDRILIFFRYVGTKNYLQLLALYSVLWKEAVVNWRKWRKFMKRDCSKVVHLKELQISHSEKNIIFQILKMKPKLIYHFEPCWL